MANVRSANTFFIDATTPTLAIKNIKVLYITVTATAASAILNLRDVSTLDNKINVRVATSGETGRFSFVDSPLVFPNGIDPNTVTNCVATLVVQESRS